MSNRSLSLVILALVLSFGLYLWTQESQKRTAAEEVRVQAEIEREKAFKAATE